MLGAPQHNATVGRSANWERIGGPDWRVCRNIQWPINRLTISEKHVAAGPSNCRGKIPSESYMKVQQPCTQPAGETVRHGWCVSGQRRQRLRRCFGLAWQDSQGTRRSPQLPNMMRAMEDKRKTRTERRCRINRHTLASGPPRAGIGFPREPRANALRLWFNEVTYFARESFVLSAERSESEPADAAQYSHSTDALIRTPSSVPRTTGEPETRSTTVISEIYVAPKVRPISRPPRQNRVVPSSATL